LSEQVNVMNEILVVKLGALGDVILSMDAFNAIRAHHPDARITLLTRNPFAPLAEKMPWFDAVLTDPNPSLFQIGKWWRLRKMLRSGGFQRVYDLQCNDRTGFYFRLFGRDNGEWCGTAKGCSHQRHDHRRDPVPAAERLLRFLESVDVPRAGAADTSWLTGDVAALGLPEKFVMIIPGCAPQHPHKRWPAAHYAELAHQLDKQGIATVAVGTGVDLAAIREIQAIAPAVMNLAGKTDIGQLAEVARKALGVVGNDTGPIHIAAITGAPTLVLMSGKTDPARMTPHGVDVGWLRRDTLADLSPSEVMESIRLRAA
jgi:ADP-heptose:LPS heptosyltransferase